MLINQNQPQILFPKKTVHVKSPPGNPVDKTAAQPQSQKLSAAYTNLRQHPHLSAAARIRLLSMECEAIRSNCALHAKIFAFVDAEYFDPAVEKKI